MKNKISFKEVLSIIDRVDKSGNAVPFDVAFRTLNRQSKKGGKLIVWKQVKKSRPKKTVVTKISLLASAQSEASIKRNPNHQKNRTRLLELQNGDLKKIHIRLIDSVNGKKMYY